MKVLQNNFKFMKYPVPACPNYFSQVLENHPDIETPTPIFCSIKDATETNAIIYEIN